MLALKAGDFETLCNIDEELTAIRPAGAVRAASTGVGKRLLSLYATIYRGEESSGDTFTLPHSNAAAAYAIVYFKSGVEERSAALAFGYNRLAGIVSAGLRLIPMGQHQGQALMTKTRDYPLDGVERDSRCEYDAVDTGQTAHS